MLRKFAPAMLVVVAALAFALPAAAVVDAQVQVLSVTSVVKKGGLANLAARAPAGAMCNLVVHGRSLGSRRVFWGTVRWTWTVARSTPAGSYPIQVKCGAAIAKTKYRIV